MSASACGAPPRISVVVPTFNRAAYLDVFLRSLTWSQVPPDQFEVIVVDDGSADDVADVVASWTSRGLDVRLHHLRDGGEPRNNARARNAGTQLARHEVVLQTDPDIVFVTDVLTAVRRELVPGTFCSVEGYFPLTAAATNQVAWAPAGVANTPAPFLAAAQQRPNQVSSPDGVHGLHGAFAIRRVDLERVGGYDESFRHWGWEDRELLVTLARDHGMTRTYMPGVAVVHLWHAQARGDLGRASCAAKGVMAYRAWELQMQRAGAEYARSMRPARLGHRDGSADRPWDRSAFDEWEAGPVDAGTPPLTWQLFFDALSLEVRQLRVEGWPAVARSVAAMALERPWESVRLPITAYRRVEVLLEECAACHLELDDREAAEAILRDLEAIEGGPIRAAVLRARQALKAGDLASARAAVGSVGPDAGGLLAALRVELALLAGEVAEASRALSVLRRAVDLDHFEVLRASAYDALIDAVQQRPLPVGPWWTSGDATEHHYSAGMRSLRDGLHVAGTLLLHTFLAGDAPAEPRLHEIGPRQRDAALARVHDTATGQGQQVAHALAAIIDDDRVTP